MTEEARILLEDIFPFGRVLVTRDGKIYDLNKQAREIFLIGGDDFTDVSFTDYLAPKFWNVFKGFLDKVFSTHQNELLDVKLTQIHPDYPTDVCIFGHVVPFGDLCQLTVMDISSSNRVPQVIDENIGQYKYNILEKTTWRSKKHGQIFGYPDSSHEWTTKLFLEAVVPEDRDRVLTQLQQALNKGINCSMEYRILRKNDDQIRWIWSINYINHNSEGTPVVMEGIVQDITELRKNQIDLLSAEERYLNLITKLDLGVVIHGPDGRILLSNPSALRLLGLTSDQLLGKTPMDPGWNVIHEDGSPYPGETHPAAITLTTGKPVLNAIMGVFRPLTQDRIWISVNSEPRFNYDGSIKDVTAMFKDVTEIVRAKGVTR
ncbi:MAG TPA: PAS domain-containing protein [Cyclobacteriaceae bacterium]|nr:PAS domain-containing protein [Cyclobacteriaceae bacterium]